MRELVTCLFQQLLSTLQVEDSDEVVLSLRLRKAERSRPHILSLKPPRYVEIIVVFSKRISLGSQPACFPQSINCLLEILHSSTASRNDWCSRSRSGEAMKSPTRQYISSPIAVSCFFVAEQVSVGDMHCSMFEGAAWFEGEDAGATAMSSLNDEIIKLSIKSSSSQN